MSVVIPTAGSVTRIREVPSHFYVSGLFKARLKLNYPIVDLGKFQMGCQKDNYNGTAHAKCEPRALGRNILPLTSTGIRIFPTYSKSLIL